MSAGPWDCVPPPSCLQIWRSAQLWLRCIVPGISGYVGYLGSSLWARLVGSHPLSLSLCSMFCPLRLCAEAVCEAEAWQAPLGFWVSVSQCV